MNNPLLDTQGLPAFASILPEHVEPALDAVLAENRAALEVLMNNGAASWDELIMPLERMGERLGRAFGPAGHLNAVMNSDALRDAYNACLPKISAYSTEIGQDTRLYQAHQKLAEQADDLSSAQRKLIDDALLDFKLSGVALPPAERERYKAIDQQLSELTQRFSDNLLDATNDWTLHIEDEARLAGLPDSAKGMLAQAAEQRQKSGWLITLEYPSYQAIITYAEDRELRATLYRAYCTRASELGAKPEWDNGPLMGQILDLRHEQAQLLGYANYAELSLATKMADSVDQVIDFLRDLAKRAKDTAEDELAELRQYAAEHCGIDELESWDAPFVAEKLREHNFNIADEALRPYLPVDSVLDGLFSIVTQVFGFTAKAVDGVETWHPDVRFFELRDESGQLRGQFYLDLFARPKKRGGAWMDSAQSRLGDEGVPVAYLVANATPPVGDKPALMTHDEVETLFHEFGHGLHHMCTQIPWPSIGGINGVEWDAVELPSQFMENWCWEIDSLQRFARHYETGEPMPEELIKRKRAARHFQTGMATLRQVEFSLFDMLLHREHDPAKGARVQETLDAVRAEVAVSIPPAFNRFPNSFGHIFAGGYAAGYYSYKWAEVLSADAFAAFEEAAEAGQSLYNREVGQRLLDGFLQRGASASAAELFRAFRGRDPSIEPLLRHSGLEEAA